MRKFFRLLSAAALILAGTPALATFHLFSMDELYSNADGSVQFVELTALAGGQQFVEGHSIRVTQGASVHSFVLPSNLPGDTSGHRMLIATQGFAALNVVAPDFIVPNGFFFQGSAQISWGEGADVWNYSNLPIDGMLSLARNGTTSTNSPMNFAGQTGTILPVGYPSAPVNYQGLWWKSPAGTESGWGVQLTHQGDTLFAAWFTYDTDGSGMWLVMTDGPKAADGSYSGALYRATGPSFAAQPFDPAQVRLTQVGSARFSFSDANNGTFEYTVNGVAQAKAITRQVFALPVPTCTTGGTAPATPNFTDLWWRSPAGSESGWGVELTHQGNVLFAAWFTYDTNGSGMWLVMTDGEKTAANTFAGALYRATGPRFDQQPFDASKVKLTQVGDATFTFSDAANGTFAYTVNGVSQSKAITRQQFATPATTCQ